MDTTIFFKGAQAKGDEHKKNKNKKIMRSTGKGTKTKNKNKNQKPKKEGKKKRKTNRQNSFFFLITTKKAKTGNMGILSASYNESFPLSFLLILERKYFGGAREKIPRPHQFFLLFSLQPNTYQKYFLPTFLSYIFHPL